MELREEYDLPTVRIQKIELMNFKSVTHGEILFDFGRKPVNHDTKADILGIYGQNGSGKTSVIEAIAILQRAMAGRPVPPRYAECISDGADHAELSFTFDLQYPVYSGVTRTVTYTFKISAVPDKSYEDRAGQASLSALYPNKVKIFDEVISASGIFNGVMQKTQPILSTGGANYPIGPWRKIPDYVGNNRAAASVELEVNKRTAAKDSRSFLFMDETLAVFDQNSENPENSEYLQILKDLKQFAGHHLYAVDTRSAGIGAVPAVPLNTLHGVLLLNLMEATKMRQQDFEALQQFVACVNTVLPVLIPGIRLELVHDIAFWEGKPGQEVKLYSKRGEARIPLRDESAGIIKLISVISLVIAAFNDKKVTVAIDELDAGIHEYLLGEILVCLESHGNGQFVFTSHNLRPLELLKKENILFTTSDPGNRYIHVKGVGQTNNLRNLYLREILGSTKNEQMYNYTEREQLIAAFQRAGNEAFLMNNS